MIKHFLKKYNTFVCKVSRDNKKTGAKEMEVGPGTLL